MLEAHNVPELSAGVNCTFEDLAEMNGLVEGNRIKCSSPAEKEMPRIIVDKGKRPKRNILGSRHELFHKSRCCTFALWELIADNIMQTVHNK